LYTRSQLFWKYVRYYLSASNGKGHGVHSPFVFEFITKVLNDKEQHPEFDKIEKIRQELLENETQIEVEDYGAGSSVIQSKKRIVKDIAASSLKKPKYAQLLYKIVKHYKPARIVELGTSFGTTTAYMATANPDAQVATFEGATVIAAVAESNFERLDINNVHVIKGNLQYSLPQALEVIGQVDMAYIDAHHKKAATLRYFDLLLNKCNEHSFLIFDDIHWSKGMEEAWQQVINHQAVTLSIDLFFVGIVFFRRDFKEKQHFTIRF
jgi:predicted O-methyltransferase YrrM